MSVSFKLLGVATGCNWIFRLHFLEARGQAAKGLQVIARGGRILSATAQALLESAAIWPWGRGSPH